MNYLYRKSKFLITIILHTLRANMSYKAPANKSNTRSKQQIKELLQLDLDKLRLSILSGYPIAKVKKLN